MTIAHYNISNVISFVDRNKCMIDGRTEDVMKLEPFCDKWTAFGFHVIEIDGNDIKALCEAIDYAYDHPEKPVMIVGNTIKGCGIDFMEDNYKWHYGAINEELYEKAKVSLAENYKKRCERAEKEGA